MDVLNVSDRCLIVVGRPVSHLQILLNSCYLLPDPFLPNSVCWFVDDPLSDNDLKQLAEAKHSYLKKIHADVDNFEFSLRDINSSSEFICERFRTSFVKPFMQQMVVCHESDGLTISDCLPVFSCFAREGDSLRLIGDGRGGESCDMKEVPITRCYSASSSQFLKLPKDELSYYLQESANPRTLTIFPDSQRIVIDGKIIGLSPLLFAFYFWMARRRKQCLNHAFSHGGLVRYDQSDVAQEFLSIYRHYCDDLSSHYEKAQFLLKESFPKNYFLEKISLIRSSLREVLGSYADAYCIHGVGKRNEMMHGILLPPEFIKFER